LKTGKKRAHVAKKRGNTLKEGRGPLGGRQKIEFSQTLRKSRGEFSLPTGSGRGGEEESCLASGSIFVPIKGNFYFVVRKAKRNLIELSLKYHQVIARESIGNAPSFLPSENCIKPNRGRIPEALG